MEPTFQKVDDDTRIISLRKDIYPRFIRDAVPSPMSQSGLRKYLARHVTIYGTVPVIHKAFILNQSARRYPC